jgi:hypothetical protein
MKNENGIVDQASRIFDIKTAIAKFKIKETNYQTDLREINDIIEDSGDTIIARLRDKINDQDSGWYLDQNGRLEISEHLTGYLPNLNTLTDYITKCLE